MATKHWEGKAIPVAQVSRAQITTFDATSTYNVVIGGVTFSLAGTGIASAEAMVDALVSALNALTHPYFAAITWAKNSTDYLQGTADVAGCPFTFTVSVTGGTGAWGAVSDTTSNAGPNVWSDGENWSDGSAPADGDVIYFKGTDQSVCWDIDQNALDNIELHIEQSFTGYFGLRSEVFATSADGVTVDADAPEYRDHYVKLGCDEAHIGEHIGPGAPVGSAVIKLHNDEAGASTLTVHDSAAQGAGTKPAIQYRSDNSGADVDVQRAPGGFGYATDIAGEASSADKIDVSASGTDAVVTVGAGCAFSTFEQRGGINTIDISGSTNPAITAHGGELTIEGDVIAGSLSIYGSATVTDNHTVASGDHITTLTLEDENAVLDWSKRGHSRQVATTNWRLGTIRADWDDVTLTTLNLGERVRGIEVRAL